MKSDELENGNLKSRTNLFNDLLFKEQFFYLNFFFKRECFTNLVIEISGKLDVIIARAYWLPTS